MIRCLVALPLALGCAGEKGISWQNDPGSLTLDGEECSDGWDTSLGYCLEGGDTFSVDGGGECGGVRSRATVWLPGDALAAGPEFALQENASALPPGEGTVWVERGDQTWKSASGTVTLDVQDIWVSATFSGEFVDFLSGEDPVSASGWVWCERP